MTFPQPHPESRQLNARRDFLREHLASLSAEEESLIRHAIPSLIARYYQEVGHREVEALRLEIEASRIKREIEMIQAAQNSGREWDYAAIQAQLDEEFAVWQAKLAQEQARLSESLNLLKSPTLTHEEAEALTKLYRALAKRLHPDLHPSLHPEKTPLWHRLQDAYGRSDMEGLRLVELLLGTDSGEESPVPQLDQLRVEVETLEQRVDSLVRRIDGIRREYPFTLRELLDDPDRLKAHRDALEEKIRIATQRREAAAARLQVLLDTPETP